MLYFFDYVISVVAGLWLMSVGGWSLNCLLRSNHAFISANTSDSSIVNCILHAAKGFLRQKAFWKSLCQFQIQNLDSLLCWNFLLTRWWCPWANYVLMMLWKGTLYSRVETEGQFQLVAIHAWSYTAVKLDLCIILVSLVHCRPSIIECIFNSITWVFLPWKKERQLSLVSRYFAQPRSKPSVGLYVVEVSRMVFWEDPPYNNYFYLSSTSSFLLLDGLPHIIFLFYRSAFAASGSSVRFCHNDVQEGK